jgi:hypothetical protein
MALKGWNLESSPPVKDDAQGPWGKIRPKEARFLHLACTNHGVEEVWTSPYEPLIRCVFKNSTKD